MSRGDESCRVGPCRARFLALYPDKVEASVGGRFEGVFGYAFFISISLLT
jgi:hypothetical protein